MKIIIQNAGAQKGILILPDENDWFIPSQYRIIVSEYISEL